MAEDQAGDLAAWTKARSGWKDILVSRNWSMDKHICHTANVLAGGVWSGGETRYRHGQQEKMCPMSSNKICRQTNFCQNKFVYGQITEFRQLG